MLGPKEFRYHEVNCIIFDTLVPQSHSPYIHSHDSTMRLRLTRRHFTAVLEMRQHTQLLGLHTTSRDSMTSPSIITIRHWVWMRKMRSPLKCLKGLWKMLQFLSRDTCFTHEGSKESQIWFHIRVFTLFWAVHDSTHEFVIRNTRAGGIDFASAFISFVGAY